MTNLAWYIQPNRQKWTTKIPKDIENMWKNENEIVSLSLRHMNKYGRFF